MTIRIQTIRRITEMAKLVEWTNPVTKKTYKYHMSSFEFFCPNEDSHIRLERAAVATIMENLSYEEFRLCVDDCLVFPWAKDQNREHGLVSELSKDTIHISSSALSLMQMVQRFLAKTPKDWDCNQLSVMMQYIDENGQPKSSSYWEHSYCNSIIRMTSC